jgi:hypothetical protein
MNYQQPDSLNISTATEGTPLNTELRDTATIKPLAKKNHLTVQKPARAPEKKKLIKSVQSLAKEQSVKSVADSVTNKKPETNTYNPFTLYTTLTDSNNTVVHIHHNVFEHYIPKFLTVEYTGPKTLNTNKSVQKEWVMGIAVFSAALFVLIRIYFQKYFSSIVTSAVNIQIAEKLTREKNVIVRRVFTLLNLNFVISSSLFIYMGFTKLNVNLPFHTSFQNYLFILIGLSGILFFRYLIILSVGSIFDSIRLFREYLHNTYLINKNLGLYLLPLIISVFYLKQPFSDIIFYVSLIIVGISILYKYIRAIQIIMRYNIFLFYTFLYLCTLEILPVLVGIKFVLSLR